MSRPKNPVPTYRLHKQSGQAVVTVNVDGRRKDILLGVYNSAESKEEYRRVLTDLEAGRLFTNAPTDLTVTELCMRFWRHAEQHYRHPDGKPTSQITVVRIAIRALREQAGHLLAREFGPMAFKNVREAMVRKGWARPTVNQCCGIVKRAFRWAVENELVPSDRWEALRSVPGLAKGRTSAPEPEPILPVPLAHAAATSPRLSITVWGMVRVQTLTGMRPGEVCRIRPCDIDTSGSVWLYKPAHHKTAYRGRSRIIPIGAKAQAVLKQFTPDVPTAYYFPPSRAVEEMRSERAAKRVTPFYPTQVARSKAKRKANPQRQPAEFYPTQSYAVAVLRAIELVNRSLVEAGVDVAEHVPHWHPNQLRHTFATEVRKAYGLEAVQVLLGHARADVSQVYAERDTALAVRVAAEVG
ncbi:MAG: site-specific integrase [Planctomycetes bacterium]|nr:site-specific integrase [Planctomycetota bacterium]